MLLGGPSAEFRRGAAAYRPGMKAETLLAELDRLRKDVPRDEGDLEFLTLHHVFCFVSYKMTEFRAYVAAEAAKGAFKAADGE